MKQKRIQSSKYHFQPEDLSIPSSIYATSMSEGYIVEVPLESEDQDPSPPSEAKDNSKHEVVLLKQEILDTIHYTKSKLYFAGCDGKVQAFRADLRIQAMFHDFLPTKYGKSYKDW